MRHSIRQCQNLATADVATLSTYHLSLAARQPIAAAVGAAGRAKRVFVYDKCNGDAALDMVDALAEARAGCQVVGAACLRCCLKLSKVINEVAGEIHLAAFAASRAIKPLIKCAPVAGQAQPAWRIALGQSGSPKCARARLMHCNFTEAANVRRQFGSRPKMVHFIRPQIDEFN